VTITFRGGRLPNDPAKPRLRLSRFLTASALPAPPPAVNWDTAVKSWPMYGNDSWGDCVWAMIGHAVQAITANASTEADVTDTDVLKAYADVTGFNPHAGPPGQNPTDQGTVIQDALNYWRKTGVGGHRIVAFAQVDVADETEMQQACALFGVVLFGMSFPAAAMDQFRAGEPWDVVDDDGGIEGGHAILGARYDATEKQWYIITWAREQPVTFAFLRRYFEEAWVAITGEWVGADGSTPSGLDLAAFGADFTALTGSPTRSPTPHRGRAHILTPWSLLLTLWRRIRAFWAGSASSTRGRQST
jgi:hypothetical protein